MVSNAFACNVNCYAAFIAGAFYFIAFIKTEKPESGQWKFGLVDRIEIQWNHTMDGFVLSISANLAFRILIPIVC